MSKRFFNKLILVIVAVLSLLFFSGVVLGQGKSNEALERVVDIQEKYTGALMARDGIEGTGVGFDDNGEPTIKIYTATAGIPGIPGHLEGVPVEAIVTGIFVARADPTARFPRPVPIGVSTGHPDITAGTIGCRVTDGSYVYALSNNHVYANANNAVKGDNVLQPGPYDGGKDPQDAIGTLWYFEPIFFDGTDNLIDAAIALSSTGNLGTATPSDGYGIPSATTALAFPGQNVQKYGRTTGWTHGEVSEINVIVDVCYETKGPFRCVKAAHFVDQIAIIPGSFSDGGDSGSLILTDDGYKNPVGLLFAGSSTRTIANPIDTVLDILGVTIDDTSEGLVNNSTPTVTIESPANGASFNSGELISFAGAASDLEDGGLTASLVWTSSINGEIGTGGSFSANLSDGNHTITAEATDSDGATGSRSISITVGTPTVATTSTVGSINYSTEGGKNNDKHLNIVVAILDDLGDPVAGASVSIGLKLNGSLLTSGAGTTGTNGTVIFGLKNAPSGTYSTIVNNVTAAGLSWDGVTPSNSFTK
jgi:hypothetical protein